MRRTKATVLTEDHEDARQFHNESLVNKATIFVNRLKKDENYNYETSDLLQNLPQEEVLKDELYAIKAIAAEKYRILLSFSRMFGGSQILNQEIHRQRKNEVWKDFVESERNLTLHRGFVIKYFLDQLEATTQNKIDYYRPDTLLTSVTKSAYAMEDDKLEYMIEFYANEIDRKTERSTAVTPHAISKLVHTTSEHSIFARQDVKQIAGVLQKFHLLEKDLPSEMKDPQKKQHLTNACESILSGLTHHVGLGISFPNVFDNNFADFSLVTSKQFHGTTADGDEYECSISAETIQLTATKGWCHPIVIEKVNDDLKGTEKTPTHIQLLAKLRAEQKDYELKWVIVPYRARKACVTFLYNKSHSQSLFSLDNTFQPNSPLQLSSEKLFVDAKELDRFDEFNLWRFHSKLCHAKVRSPGPENLAYLFISTQLTVLVSCHRLKDETATAYTIIQWLPNLSHVDRRPESTKITVLEKHIHDIESRLTMATGTEQLCSEVIPEIIKGGKNGFYIITQTKPLDMEMIEENVREADDEIIKTFTKYIHGLKERYEKDAKEKGYKAPKTNRLILNRYCCEVWGIHGIKHDWAEMRSSPNYPKIRYPTQYPGIVINFLRTLKEQMTRDATSKTTREFEQINITKERIDKALKKRSEKIRNYLVNNIEKYKSLEFFEDAMIGRKEVFAKVQAARNSSEDRAMERKIKLRNLRLHERMVKSGYVSTPHRVSVPRRATPASGPAHAGRGRYPGRKVRIAGFTPHP